MADGEVHTSKSKNSRITADFEFVRILLRSLTTNKRKICTRAINHISNKKKFVSKGDFEF